MKVWSRQFTLEFIEVLHSMQFMWDMQHPDYRSPSARLRGYEELVDKAREVDSGATILDIKRKIKGLRTNLKKMERRVLAYRRCGLDHTPSLFYYQPLSFLLTQTRPVGNSASKAAAARRSISDGSDAGSVVAVGANEEAEEQPAEEEEDGDSGEIVVHRHSRHSEILDCDVFGQYVAAKLVSIAKLQRVFLEKIINDAIYQAELGNLSAGTRLFKEQRMNNSLETFMVDMSTDPNRINDNIVVYNQHNESAEYIVDHQYALEPPVEHTRDVKMEEVEEQDKAGESWNGNQIVPESGSSQIIVQRAQPDESGSSHYILERIHAGPSGSSTVVAERIHPLPAGAVLERIEDRVHFTAQNGIITIHNKKAVDDAIMAGKTILVQNGAVLEPNQRQGVIVEKNVAEAGLKRYVVKEPQHDGNTLRNVQFADDDLMKMCEDDGITIICVESVDGTVASTS